MSFLLTKQIVKQPAHCVYFLVVNMKNLNQYKNMQWTTTKTEIFYFVINTQCQIESNPVLVSLICLMSGYILLYKKETLNFFGLYCGQGVIDSPVKV